MITVWLGSVDERKGEALLTAVLSRQLNCDPQALRIQRAPSGKPFLEPVSGQPELHFSLSHSRDRWAIAVSELGPLGVDLELCDTSRPLERLAQRYFTAAEWDCFQRLAAADRPHYFFDCWTLKEAFVKAGGRAMATTMGKVGFAPINDCIAYVQAAAPEDDASRGFWMFEPAPKWHLALCLEAPTAVATELRFLDEQGEVLQMSPRARGTGLRGDL